MIPVVCDEKVLHMVFDIVMSESTVFRDASPMLAMFHMTKVLLRCTGRYVSGSGMKDALRESVVFGKRIFTLCCLVAITFDHYEGF